MSAALRHLRRAHPELRGLISQHGPPDLRRTRDALESLTRAIVYQQLSGKAAATIYGRFRALYPESGGRFPEPAAIAATPVAALRAAGLSSGKAAIDARRFGRMTDGDIIELLTQVKGIGEWTAHMFLIFGLNRPDVLPVGDLGVRRGMQTFFRLRGLPAPARMERLAAPWKPYRSIGSWYMWRVKADGT